jgi:hypothetical protein
MKTRASKRDRHADIIKTVRDGGMRTLFPAELNFDLSFEGTSIANFVDVVARQMAEGIAPLPSLACVSGSMKSDKDLQRAENKNRIGGYYWDKSKLESQMLWGADQFVTYGFLPFFIEPNVPAQRPYIQIEDPYRSYYELDRFGHCTYFAHRYMRTVDDLCSQFPEYENIIRTRDAQGKYTSGDTELELIKFVDNHCVYLFLPQRNALKLAEYQHRMKFTPVVIAERPGHSRQEPRGQFDDVVWVQVARAIMSILALEAAHTAVQAPLVLPDDMDELPIGPKAVYQTANPQGVQRPKLDLPPTIFAEVQNLESELHTGARYPQAAAGNLDASVITGKGVEELMGTFDGQVKGAQTIFKQALEDATRLCFEMDDKWWPNVRKTIRGTTAGRSYEFTYTAAGQIAGRYTCTVSYGFASGMRSSAQAIVTMLQLEGAGLIAKATLQDNLPFGLDPLAEQRAIHIETTREAIKQGIFGVIQASGQMAAQGQDPTPFLKLAVDAIHAIENGDPVEDAFYQAFAQMQQAQQQRAQAAQQAQSQAGAGPGGPAGADQFAAQQGLAGQPPGGAPTVEQMRAGFRGQNIQPTLDAFIQRKTATGV